MALLIRVAAHPDDLVSGVAAVLARPPHDPFAAELVAVPTRGIERWLAQRIAAELAGRGVGEGICANIRFPSPRRLVNEVLGAVPGLAQTVAGWERAALIAGVLDVIDASGGEPWFALLGRYVAGRKDDIGAAPNRLAAAVKLAGLFDGYARRRPEMVRVWAAGVDGGPDGNPLPEPVRWQPAMWRAVRERIGAPSLPEVLAGGLDDIRRGAITLTLPDRVTVYGVTTLDPLELDVLETLATQRDVYVAILHPSPALWLAAADALATLPPWPVARETDPTADVAVHPMLRSWAGESRELQVVLAGRRLAGSDVTTKRPVPATLLGRLQTDIRDNRPLRHDREIAAGLDAGTDRSIQIHVCHGDRRQVEVLRDAVLHVLAADPSLEARDVVVMTPDLAAFAPLLEGAFPAGEAAADDSGLPDLRLRVADRSPAATNPLVRFAATVLDLAACRLAAGDVRELVGRGVVQQRFGFDADTAGAVVGVIDESNVRWGLDATDRRRWGAGDGAERTWRRAVDRALAGVFTADGATRVVGDVAPLSGVEGQDAVAVATLAALIDRIAAIRTLLGAQLPMSQWAAAIAASVRMLAAPAWGDEWQWGQLDRLLAETFPAPGAGRPDPPVGLAEARRAIAVWADDRPSPLHFRTGDITVCTLAPMRSVPYRVVCLLGMDDDRFPRTSRADGDDLLLGQEIVGDHDRAAQDRQLLLDAVMAAGDHLLITYQGKDELTGATYPPAVPIAELMDTVTAMVGESGRERVVVVHPLQPFAADNFTAGALGIAGPWGFDPTQLAAAQAAGYRAPAKTSAAARAAAATPTVGETEWPVWDETIDIRLDELITFLQHPVRRFVRTRIGFSIPERGDVPDDSLPVVLGGLDAWGVTDRLLAGLLAGYDIDALVARERSADSLPPGDLATPVVAAAVDAATVLAGAAADRNVDPARHHPWSGVVTAGDRRIEGSVAADPEQGHIAVVTASRIKASTRLRVFAELAFLTALEPETAWQAILIGRRDHGDGHMAVVIDRLGSDADRRRSQALELLGGLVALYVEGHRRPLPIPCETAFAWQRRAGSDRARAADLAREKWEGGRFSEARDPAHALMFPDLTATQLIDVFADYCERLWGPLLWRMRERNV